MIPWGNVAGYAFGGAVGLTFWGGVLFWSGPIGPTLLVTAVPVAVINSAQPSPPVGVRPAPPAGPVVPRS